MQEQEEKERDYVRIVLCTHGISIEIEGQLPPSMGGVLGEIELMKLLILSAIQRFIRTIVHGAFPGRVFDVTAI